MSVTSPLKTEPASSLTRPSSTQQTVISTFAGRTRSRVFLYPTLLSPPLPIHCGTGVNVTIKNSQLISCGICGPAIYAPGSTSRLTVTSSVIGTGGPAWIWSEGTTTVAHTTFVRAPDLIIHVHGGLKCTAVGNTTTLFGDPANCE